MVWLVVVGDFTINQNKCVPSLNKQMYRSLPTLFVLTNVTTLTKTLIFLVFLGFVFPLKESDRAVIQLQLS